MTLSIMMLWITKLSTKRLFVTVSITTLNSIEHSMYINYIFRAKMMSPGGKANGTDQKSKHSWWANLSLYKHWAKQQLTKFHCNFENFLSQSLCNVHRDRTRANTLCFLFLFFISSFEHVKSLLIMVPINTKTVHKNVILSYSTMKMF